MSQMHIHSTDNTEAMQCIKQKELETLIHTLKTVRLKVD